ncbi:MAG: hypothetical protein ABSH05_00020 [Bryobacteraceae bacterium]|jgi:hypothetical protein
MKPVLLCLLVSALSAADLPKLIYSKSFPHSLPEYAAIAVDKEGNGSYKEATDDDSPLLFKLTPKETEELFALADKLGRFTRPLESGLKVAMLGIKTFRYENGPEKNEVKFNYSLDLDAQKLLDWFERISDTEQLFIVLERAVKFDKLGVNQALLELETARDHKRLVSPQQFLPLLDRIVKNESFMHMSRTRAAALAEDFRRAPEAP